MNRNTEEHFANVPRLNISRSSFNRSNSILTTMREGDIVPVYVDEMLPGDTANVSLASLIRMATPLYPVMDNAYIDFHFFFVPNRLVWEHWRELCGENTQTYWAQRIEYTTPRINAPEGGWAVGTIADYMGIPTQVPGLSVNALPFRAYALIYNEWYRDENLCQPAVCDKNDATHTGSNLRGITHAQLGGLPLKAAKFHDYFTSALPAPQKGPEILLPLGNEAPVYGRASQAMVTQIMRHDGSGRTSDRYIGSTTGDAALYSMDANGQKVGDTDNTFINIAEKAAGRANWGTTVYADLTQATAATINQLRQAIAIQHIFEADARNGTRYSEILQHEFGVTAPDARLQEPEYVGGHRMPINISQVVQTSGTDSVSPQGNTGAYSLTTGSQHICTYSAVEHGFLMGMAVIRVDHSYQQGLRRMWNRSDRFSYYHPMLANLGEMPILNEEIFAQGSAVDKEVFGYQEAWADYRYKPNTITGEMRSTYAQSLDAWHYGDKYTELPMLSSSWIEEGEENIDRTLAVSTEQSAQFLCNFYFNEVWARPMPIYSVPGINTI